MTAILEAAGNTTITDATGKRTARKKQVAESLWEAATTGKATLPTQVLEIAPADWLGIIKFIYGQVDGPPRAEVDVTTNGQALTADATAAAYAAAHQELTQWQAEHPTDGE